MNRFALIARAIRDRRHDEPASGASRRGYVEDQVIRGINAVGQVLRTREKKAVEPRLVRLSHAVKQADTVIRPEFERLVAVASGRTYVLHVFSAPIHWLLIGGISLGEFAFNSLAFGLFGDATWLTWLMALGVAVGLPLAAHLLGVEIRQAKWSRPRLAAWILVCAFVIAVLVGINYIRSRYLQVMADGADGGIGVGPAMSVAYLSMNILIFVAATAISYGAYDPVHRLATVRRRLMAGGGAIQSLRGSIRQWEAVTAVQLEELSEAGLAQLMHYRSSNRRGRQQVPDYFDNPKCADYQPRFFEHETPKHAGQAIPEGSRAK